MNSEEKLGLVDYVNQIITFFFNAQKKRAELNRPDVPDNQLLWKYIESEKQKTPLPIPSEYFRCKNQNLLLLGVMKDLDLLVARLNETDDVVVWKRGINRLYQILQPNQNKWFYPGEDYDPDLSLDEPCD